MINVSKLQKGTSRDGMQLHCPERTASLRRLWLALAVAVTVAVALRLWGIDFGLPLTAAHPDESRVNYEGIAVLGGNFRPGFFNYPSLFMYALGLADAGYCVPRVFAGTYASIGACAASWRTAWEPFFLAARLLSAVAGIATVPLVYALGSRLCDRAAGLSSSAFLAVAFLHVRDSHFGVTDVAMTMLLVLAVMLLVRARDLAGEPGGSLRRFAVAGFVAGLATSTKYNAVLLAVPAVVSIVQVRSLGRRRMAALLAVCGACMAVGFFAGTPFALLEPARFWQDASSEASHLQAGHSVHLGIGWAYHLAVTLRHGLTWPLLVAAVAGAIWMSLRAPRQAALLLAFPVVYYLVAGRGYTVFARYMIPVVPFLCVAAGFLAAALARKLAPSGRGTAVACTAIVAVIGAPSAVKSWQLDRLLQRTDSRVLAADWITGHAAPNASIYVTGSHYGRPDIRRRHSGPEYTNVELGDTGFRTAAGVPVDDPDWIVVQESPLVGYSFVPPRVRDALPRYHLVQTFRAVDMRQPHVYDQQDAWFVPLAGLSGVGRPGPNFLIYRRRQETEDRR